MSDTFKVGDFIEVTAKPETTDFGTIRGTALDERGLLAGAVLTTQVAGPLLAQDAADTAVMFETTSTSDTITMNGSTKGGIVGDLIELIDADSGFWQVRVIGSATGTEATPFSAAVS